MAFDGANPPAAPDAKNVLAQIAKLLNVDPSDADAMTKALASLVEAAGGNGAPQPSNQVNANAVERGRKYLNGTAKRSNWVDPEAIARGRKLFK